MIYEAHITMDPVQGEVLESVRGMARACLFSCTEEPQDYTEKQSRNDAFLTGHSKDFHVLKTRTSFLVEMLIKAGINVRRYKIEDIVIDSKIDDTFRLLGERT